MSILTFRSLSRSTQLAAAAVAALLTSSGCSSRAGADRIPPPPLVAVVEARQMTVPILAEPFGTTRAVQEVSIRARVRGFLKEVHFDEGGDVKADQLLFVIDEEPFKAKLSETRARLEAAEAALKKARDSKAREIAAAQLALGKSMLELAEVEERREQTLLKRSASTIEDVQRKQAVRKKDAAQVEAAIANLDQAKADYDTDISAAQAEVDSARALVADAEINLSYCRMFSPIDGRISLVKVKRGNLVGPTTGAGEDYTELAVVRQLDPMGVDIQVSSRYLERVARLIARGLPIEVVIPGVRGESERRFQGKGNVIDNAINPTTSTFLVRAEFPNPDETVLPGEYVKINAAVGEVQDAVVVPERAVVETQAGSAVYTVDSQGKVVLTSVRATLTYQGLRVLESGVQAGQPVIVEGLQLVRNGLTVKTRPASSTAAQPSGDSSGKGRSSNPETATSGSETERPVAKPASTAPKTLQSSPAP